MLIQICGLHWWQVLLTIALAVILGIADAKAQSCGPSTDKRGHNGECYTVNQCGYAHFCIDMPCYVYLGEVQAGCWAGRVNECIFMGCYNFAWGNCQGC